ncbi:hypothetical protein Psuf_035370 [Phytohabitans suffuscus]|uniref:Uncharacterized protein n=1 Tax=Phytohabitans suffuscus TaxID=624315 RepID=A0A6F8YJB6_9ACTN|nr:hypothetical protein Psuf_035370 [Phytohabitans suffuscus]
MPVADVSGTGSDQSLVSNQARQKVARRAASGMRWWGARGGKGLASHVTCTVRLWISFLESVKNIRRQSRIGGGRAASTGGVTLVTALIRPVAGSVISHRYLTAEGRSLKVVVV